MPVLDRLLQRHWAALVAAAAILIPTVAFARWESGSVSVAATTPVPGEVRQAAFAVGPDGTSYAAWTRGDPEPRLELATGRGPDLGETIEVPLATGTFDPRIATGRDSALVAFHSGPPENTHVMALRVSRDGHLTGPMRLSMTPATGPYLAVEAADDGSGVVAWTQSEHLTDQSGAPAGIRDRLVAATIGPSGQASTEQIVTEDAGYGGPSLAVAPDGRAALGWTATGVEVQTGVRTGGLIQVAEAPPGGGFAPAATVPDRAGDAALGESVGLAYTRDGALRAAWVEQAGAGTAATYTGVTAVRRAGGFEDRIELVDNPLQHGLGLVALPGGELVGFGRGGPGGIVPEEAWLDVVAVSARRVLGRDALPPRGRDLNDDAVAPTLTAFGAGAAAVWASETQIAHAVCSLDGGCGDPRKLVTAGRGEKLDLSGIGPGALAWLVGREFNENKLRLGRLD